MIYIALEGIDTAGKSTQIAALRQHFPDALVTKEPGATPLGSKIRSIVLDAQAKSKKAEFLLFLADRAEHIEQVIKPNLHKKMIISDRSAVSGVAYALVQKTILPSELVAMNNFATDSLYPKKVFLLKLTPQELQYRLSQKELDGIELRGIEYLLQIQDAIIEAAKLLNIELIEIDATLPVEIITDMLLQHIKR